VIVSDNGPEFTGRALDRWASQHRVRLHFIQPGKPTQNAFIESFNGTLREECLSVDWFLDLLDARSRISRWRQEYNECRPHSPARERGFARLGAAFGGRKTEKKSRFQLASDGEHITGAS
jgi:putative transposase